MNKKRLLILAGVTLTVLLLAGLGGAALVFAQEPTPPVPFGWHGGGRGGFGGRGMGGFGWTGGSPWTMFDTAAETLGLIPEELFAELRAGKSLAEIAEEQGVEVEEVYDAASAARAEAIPEAIEQAVEDGTLTQEQADWMLEGLEQGFFPGGRGFGSGRGRGGGYYPDGECPCGSH
jgi:uncharacterized membrane protein